jgi:CRP-like cAMP-binding protein
LAGYAVLVFAKEELDALRVLLQLDPTWTLWVDRVVSLLGPLLCLPFGFWLASLVTSRFRAPIAMLGGGIGLYGLQALLPPGPIAAVLATTGVVLLAAGLLIYQILHRRWHTVRTIEASPLADDASRLADSMQTLVAQLLDDLVAQSGRRAVNQLQARFNLAAEQAGWGLSLRELRLEEAQRRDLLSAAPVYRQALVLLLDEAAARSGRPFVERALGRAWDAIPWDRREVVDAWVLDELAWGGVGFKGAVGRQADRLRFLRRVPIFAGLDEAELGQISKAFETRRARVGARIIRQGEPGDTYYLIRSGVVEVLKRDGNQPETVVARLGEGDGFGELALLYDQPRSASVRALTLVELLTLRRADFDRLLREQFSLLDKLGPALERERLLSAIPLFSGLSPRELAMLTHSLTELAAEPGQVVVQQGALGDSFYLVVEGRLAVTVDDSSGAARTVARLGPGEYFGEMALLQDQPRSATVTAEVPSLLLVLHKAGFERLLWRQNSANRDLQLVASRRRLDLAAKLGAQ